MKEIKETKTVEELKGYEAFDGSFFTAKEECEFYESSAINVLLRKLAPITLCKGTHYDLFDGSDDIETIIIAPKTQKDIDIILHLLSMSEHNILPDVKNWIGHVISFNYRLYKNSKGFYDFDCVWTRDLNNVINQATDGKYELKPVKNGK